MRPMTPLEAVPYLQHGNEDLQRLAHSYLTLLVAVHKLYYTAHWTADRNVDELALWQGVRDAAGFEEGKSPVPTELLAKFKALVEESLKPAADQ